MVGRQMRHRPRLRADAMARRGRVKAGPPPVTTAWHRTHAGDVPVGWRATATRRGPTGESSWPTTAFSLQRASCPAA